MVPADVVSGIGQGNTLAGAKGLAGGLPKGLPGFARGGGVTGEPDLVPAKVSAGEFFVHPAHVAALGGGSLKAGSDRLDAMVTRVRGTNARVATRMPPPK